MTLESYYKKLFSQYDSKDVTNYRRLFYKIDHWCQTLSAIYSFENHACVF